MLLFTLTSVTDSNDLPDTDSLLHRVAMGDRDALGVLYQQTHTAIYAYALSILKNDQDAQDVLHDSFLAIVKGAVNYQGRGKARAWMHTIAHNLCIQKLRDRKKTDIPPLEDWIMLPDRRKETTTEDRIVLEACMERLSDDERCIVVLHAVSGLKHHEIAKLLGMPLSTVLSKYRRSLSKLRQMLEKGENTI